MKDVVTIAPLAGDPGLIGTSARTDTSVLRVLSPAFIAREHLLSPDQYELVDVRTRSGVRRAMLFPKAILQTEFEANREVLAMKREGWRAKRAAKQP